MKLDISIPPVAELLMALALLAFASGLSSYMVMAGMAALDRVNSMEHCMELLTPILQSDEDGTSL